MPVPRITLAEFRELTKEFPDDAGLSVFIAVHDVDTSPLVKVNGRLNSIDYIEDQNVLCISSIFNLAGLHDDDDE